MTLLVEVMASGRILLFAQAKDDTFPAILRYQKGILHDLDDRTSWTQCSSQSPPRADSTLQAHIALAGASPRNQRVPESYK